jgi:hypothetical protein
MPAPYIGLATTLANIREIGVRSLRAASPLATDAGCECGRRVIVDVAGLPRAVEDPTLRRRLKSYCFK